MSQTATRPILVVDDEEGPREALRMMLKDKHTVLMARDGEECLELVNRESPGLILLDVRLPGIDGIEVLQKLKKSNPEIPVIVVSAVGTHKTVIDALKLGAIDFVAKPLDVMQIRDTVRRALLQGETGRKTDASARKKGIQIGRAHV